MWKSLDSNIHPRSAPSKTLFLHHANPHDLCSVFFPISSTARDIHVYFFLLARSSSACLRFHASRIPPAASNRSFSVTWSSMLSITLLTVLT